VIRQLPIRLGLQQRVLPAYRIPFFDALAGACASGLCVFAGEPRRGETIATSSALQSALYVQAANRHFLGGSLYVCWQAGLLDWLKDWQPDVLIVEANPRYLRTPAAVNWMHAHGRPVIGWGLGAPSIEGAFTRLRLSFRQAFLDRFDALVAYSRQGADQYAASGIDPQRIFVAPNAATPRPTRPAPQRPDQPAGQPVVLFVGRLQARKRVDLLIRACAALPVPLQPSLWVVGEGPAQAELQALARQVYPAATFYGARHGADLEPLFEQADLFALPGTGGLAVQQAMSYALPVIVAAGDGTQSDLLRPGNGWSIPPGDLDALVAALKMALSDLPRLRRMGLESYRIVAEEVNVERMVEQFRAAIGFVLHEPTLKPEKV
jgi:glycosyltransferase involved in cell wall biosynthesis